VPDTPVTTAVNVAVCPLSIVSEGIVRRGDTVLVDDELVELEELVEDEEFTTKVKDPVFARLLASPW
jgi:hypothetical protein